MVGHKRVMRWFEVGVRHDISIPGKEALETEEFYDGVFEEALRKCLEKDYEAVFMPSIIDTRIESPDDARIWDMWFSTPSIKATGRTERGTPVVVYAHVPNYFSDPGNIKKSRKDCLIPGAGIIPEEEFQRLLDLEDNENVFVVDHNSLRKAGSCFISLEEALRHPQTIPFLGGQERAERYLERHEKAYGDQIGISHRDDLASHAFGQLLFLGLYYDCSNCSSHLGGLGRDYGGNFVGVRAKGTA